MGLSFTLSEPRRKTERMTVDEFRALALSLPHAVEKPHFDRASFRVDAPRGKTIATLLESAATPNGRQRRDNNLARRRRRNDRPFGVEDVVATRGAAKIAKGRKGRALRKMSPSSKPCRVCGPLEEIREGVD